jgi:hypothetical protein
MLIQNGEVYHRYHFPIFLWYKKKVGIETWSERRVHSSLNLTDGYFHIPISPKFLRFVWEDMVYTLSRRCLLAYLQPL